MEPNDKSSEEAKSPEDIAKDEPTNKAVYTEDSLPEVETKLKEALPDDDGKPDPTVLRIELEKLKTEIATKDQLSAKERETSDKRIKDTQSEYHKTTEKLAELMKNAGEPPQERGESLEEYTAKILTKYEDDPREGLKQYIHDMAVNNDAMYHTVLKAVQASEERSVKRSLEQMPSYGERKQKLAEFDKDNPELVDLPEEKKMVILTKFKSTPPATVDTDVTASIGSGSRVRTSPAVDKAKSWVHDPEIQKKAKSLGFTSKAELLKYAGEVNKQE